MILYCGGLGQRPQRVQGRALAFLADGRRSAAVNLALQGGDQRVDIIAVLPQVARVIVALLRDGDRIMIDAGAGTIAVSLSDEALAARRAEWSPRRTDYQSGAIWKFAQLVGPAHLGAVTHPGGAAETHCYADI